MNYLTFCLYTTFCNKRTELECQSFISIASVMYEESDTWIMSFIIRSCTFSRRNSTELISCHKAIQHRNNSLKSELLWQFKVNEIGCILQCVRKNATIFLFELGQMLTDFRHSSIRRLINKFLPYISCVATLPCEILLSEKKQQQPETCTAVNYTSQGNVATWCVAELLTIRCSLL